MSARRIVQAVITLALSATVVFGAAGMASAAFLGKTTAGTQSVSTLTLQRPTNLVGECSSNGSYQVVNFTPSPSISIINARPTGSATYPLGYSTVLTVDGRPDAAGTKTLSSNATQLAITRPCLAVSTCALTITTTYDNWTSVAAKLQSTC